MRPYETMFVLKPDLEEEQLNSLIERSSQVITTQGGTIDNVDRWGKRRLAYEVEGFREGYYVIIRFQGGPALASELDRTFRITDEVMRHVILRADNVTPRAPERRDEPRLPEPRATEPGTVEPKAGEPRVTEPRATEPRIIQPRTAALELPVPKAQKPKESEPKAAEPKAVEPSAEEPSAAEPETTEQVPELPVEEPK